MEFIIYSINIAVATKRVDTAVTYNLAFSGAYHLRLNNFFIINFLDFFCGS